MAGAADGVEAPPPTTVWMVHKDTGKQGVRGELTLEAERLIFRPEIAGRNLDLLGETVFAPHEIRGARKAKGSPVLKLDVSTPGLPKVVLFYFTKPPDMYSSPMPNPRIGDNDVPDELGRVRRPGGRRVAEGAPRAGGTEVATSASSRRTAA